MELSRCTRGPNEIARMIEVGGSGTVVNEQEDQKKSEGDKEGEKRQGERKRKRSRERATGGGEKKRKAGKSLAFVYLF